MQHEAGVRKNSRLQYMLPPDVLMLKGEVLKAAISHHEVDSLKHLNRVKREMYEMYSIKKTPSIQAVRWRPEHSGLVMTGAQLGDQGHAYGYALKAPPDRYLKKAESAKAYHSSLDSTKFKKRPSYHQEQPATPREQEYHQQHEEHKNGQIDEVEVDWLD